MNGHSGTLNRPSTTCFLVAVGLVTLLSGAAAETRPKAVFPRDGYYSRYPGARTAGNNGSTLIAVGASGAAYVQGTASPAGGNEPGLTTLKFAVDGRLEWAANYPVSASEGAGPGGLRVDALGNVYSVGSTMGAGSNFDYTTIKYSATGQQLWAARFNGPGNGRDYAWQLGLDASGNVYVSGVSTGTNPVQTLTLVKYDNQGQLLWVARDGLDNKLGGKPVALAVTPDGTSYLACGLGLGDGREEIALVRCDALGNRVWVTRNNGGGSHQTQVTGMVLTPVGDICLCGTTWREGFAKDLLTVKYATNGTVLWTAFYDSPRTWDVPNDDLAVGLATDGDGNLYVAGKTPPRTSGLDFTSHVIAYHPSGRSRWTAHCVGLWPNGIAVDPASDVYVAGTVAETMAVLDYSPVGARRWMAQFPLKLSAGTAVPWVFLAVDQSSSVYLTSTSDLALGGKEIVLGQTVQTICEYLENDSFRVRGVVAPSQTVHLQASTDFREWSGDWLTTADATGFFRIDDPEAATLPCRFYRMLPP